MRICFIAMGTFTHADAYIDFFAGRGYEVSFVALAEGPQRKVPTYNAGFDSGLYKLLGKYRYLASMSRARGIVRKLAPDIVHAHYATSAGLAARVIDVHPWMVTAHGTDVALGVQSRLWSGILRKIFLQADCINAVSEELREIVLSLGAAPSKVETFTLGIDTELFQFHNNNASDFRRSPLRLICTRRFEPVYDHSTIIKSMAELKRRGVDCRLTLVGDGILRQALEVEASDLQVRDRITFAGMVPNSRLPDALQGHNVYISASTRDGTSLCLLEAMAYGLYPVVSDIRANREWIQHGRNGFLHKVSDPISLADCIASLMKPQEPLMTTLLHNRALVEEKGDRTVNMIRLESVYRKLNSAAAKARPSSLDGAVPSTGLKPDGHEVYGNDR